MKNIFLIFLLCSVAACAEQFDISRHWTMSNLKSEADGQIIPNPNVQTEKVAAFDNDFSEVFKLPEMEVLLSKYKSAQLRYDATKASQGFKLTGSGDFGARNEANNEGVATASLTGQKSLNLQSENTLTLSILEGQKDLLKLDITSAIDKILGQVMSYELSQMHLDRMRLIYEKYKSMYQQNRPALDAAISAGVINSSENFKFRKTFANYDRKIHEADAAHALFELNVKKYIDAVKGKYTDISNLSADDIAGRATSEKDLLEISKLTKQASIFKSELALLEGQKKPQGSFVSRLTSPAAVDENWSAFVGINIILPIYDGGEKDLLIEEKLEQSKGVEASINAVQQRNSDSQKQLTRYLLDAKKTLAMLADEQKLSNEVVEDLKTRLGYGGASISDLVSEMMVLAELEFQVLDKQRELRSQVLEYASNYGIVCSLTGSCDSISGSIENIGK